MSRQSVEQVHALHAAFGTEAFLVDQVFDTLGGGGHEVLFRTEDSDSFSKTGILEHLKRLRKEGLITATAVSHGRAARNGQQLPGFQVVELPDADAAVDDIAAPDEPSVVSKPLQEFLPICWDLSRGDSVPQSDLMQGFTERGYSEEEFHASLKAALRAKAITKVGSGIYWMEDQYRVGYERFCEIVESAFTGEKFLWAAKEMYLRYRTRGVFQRVIPRELADHANQVLVSNVGRRLEELGLVTRSRRSDPSDGRTVNYLSFSELLVEEPEKADDLGETMADPGESEAHQELIEAYMRCVFKLGLTEVQDRFAREVFARYGAEADIPESSLNDEFNTSAATVNRVGAALSEHGLLIRESSETSEGALWHFDLDQIVEMGDRIKAEADSLMPENFMTDDSTQQTDQSSDIDVRPPKDASAVSATVVEAELSSAALQELLQQYNVLYSEVVALTTKSEEFGHADGASALKSVSSLLETLLSSTHSLLEQVKLDEQARRGLANLQSDSILSGADLSEVLRRMLEINQG